MIFKSGMIQPILYKFIIILTDNILKPNSSLFLNQRKAAIENKKSFIFIMPAYQKKLIKINKFKYLDFSAHMQ